MFQYSEEYQFAVNLAKEAAQLFIPAYNSHKDIEVKDSSSDLVTGEICDVFDTFKTSLDR